MSTKKTVSSSANTPACSTCRGAAKSIAEKVGVSAQTVTKWVADGGWEQARAAANITRPELVNKILNSINVLLEDLAADPSPEKTAASADKLVKFAATVERLDKKNLRR